MSVPALCVGSVSLLARYSLKGNVGLSRRMLYFVTGGYRSVTWYWEAISLVRKLVLTLLRYFATDAKIQLLLSMWVAGLFVWATMNWQPWAYRRISQLELCSLVLLTTAYGSAFLLLLVDDGTGYQWMASITLFIAIQILSVLVFLTAIVWALHLVIRKALVNFLGIANDRRADIAFKCKETRESPVFARYMWPLSIMAHISAQDDANKTLAEQMVSQRERRQSFGDYKSIQAIKRNNVFRKSVLLDAPRLEMVGNRLGTLVDVLKQQRDSDDTDAGNSTFAKTLLSTKVADNIVAEKDDHDKSGISLSRRVRTAASSFGSGTFRRGRTVGSSSGAEHSPVEVSTASGLSLAEVTFRGAASWRANPLQSPRTRISSRAAFFTDEVDWSELRLSQPKPTLASNVDAMRQFVQEMLMLHHLFQGFLVSVRKSSDEEAAIYQAETWEAFWELECRCLIAVCDLKHAS